MTKPKIRIHNTETNEVIDREMTDSEFEQYQATKIADQTEQAKTETKEIAKADLLEKLGITAQEAVLLLS